MRENKISCQQARRFYFDFLTGRGSPESAMELEHIQQCLHCQEQVKRLESELDRKSDSPGDPSDLLATHHRCLSEWIDCDVVKPFLSSLAHPGLGVQAQTPVTAHIDQCQACQQDLKAIFSMGLSSQQLVEATQILSNQPVNPQHLSSQEINAIQAIRERTPSGIVTRLCVDPRGHTHLQVRPALPAQPARRHFLVRFTAAAGILLAASLVIMMTTTAGGISIQEVYNAIHVAQNCRIEIHSIDEGKQTAIQTILVSRELNLAVSQHKDQTVILDFQNHKILKSTPQSGIETQPSQMQIVSELGRGDFGLLPFESAACIPSGYQWKHQDLMSQDSEYDIYELSWVDSSVIQGSIEKIWRGYLHRGSHLPAKIQWLQKKPKQDWDLVTEAMIQYPDTQSAVEELRANPLYYLLKGDQIK